MKTKVVVLITTCAFLLATSTSCSLFGPKYGCPGNGKNVGAERVLSGEKLPKARKFKS